MSVSILILTLNEEINISACIDSVAWSDDIIVLDSISSDATNEIALTKGARVVERKFDNWSSHQNWAMENIQFKHSWVFYIDADERCSDDLGAEILSKVNEATGNIAAYRVKRRDIFMGRWLKRAQLYPTWLVRLFKPGSIRFERLVNPIPVVDGQIAELKNDIVHHPFSHGIAHWIDRHNKYSNMEAIENSKLIGDKSWNIFNTFSLDPNIRRAALKNIFYLFPFRPLVKFFYYYFVRRGFLDGRAGFHYSTLQAFYEYLIVLKKTELSRKEQGLPL